MTFDDEPTVESVYIVTILNTGDERSLARSDVERILRKAVDDGYNVDSDTVILSITVEGT